MPIAIAAHQLSKKFNEFTAVDKLSFEVESSKIVGFLGPNGSGKSTTLRMLMGLIQPSGGEVFWFGKDMKQHRSDIMNRVGCIIEKPDFYGYLSALDNLKILSRASNLNLGAKEYSDLLEKVGLLGREKDKVKTYSHGMKQRLGLAQALLHNPDLIILDEPNTGLDPQGIIDLRNTILDLNRNHHKTILFSSHILSEVQEICDELIVLHKGKLVVSGSVSQLLSYEKLSVTVEAEGIWNAVQSNTISLPSNSIDKLGDHVIKLKMSKSEIPNLVQSIQKEGLQLLRLDYKNQLEDYFLQITQS